MPSTIDSALNYIANGWPVLALWSAQVGRCCCPDGDACKSPGKHPRADLCPHGVNDATLDPATVASWPQDVNLGAALGSAAGGVMAFDVDDREAARELLDANLGLSDQTGVVFTGRAGCHVWFRTTGATQTFHLKRASGDRLGEVRGDGAYVVVPPSASVTGRNYRWVGRRDEDPLPQLESTTDAFVYCKTLLAAVGIEVEDRDLTALQNGLSVPADSIYPLDIPPAIETYSSLFMFRQAFKGGASRIQEPDRSGKLHFLAHALVEAAANFRYPITAEEIAGVLKKADMVAFETPKYADRGNADEHYWKLALIALPQRKLEVQQQVTAPATTAPAVQPLDYFWDESEGWLYWQAGPRSTRKVCNFQPEILEDIEVDLGAGSEVDVTRAWRVQFTLKDGRSRQFVLDCSDKESAPRLEAAISRECPASYTVEPGMYGRLKSALGYLSEGTFLPRRVFGATGWVEHGECWLYLLPGAAGAIGPDGLVPAVKIDRDRLPKDSTIIRDSFQAYGRGVRPPLSREESAAAFHAFQALLDVGDADKVVPIVLQVLGGPLASLGAGEIPPLVHITGKTGTLKTSYCLAAISLFGTFTATSPTPASWSSTANFLQIFLHITKDLTLLIDDYKRSVVGSSRREVVRIIQNYADRTTRGRAKANQEVDVTKVPRGLLLTNGEDKWEAESSAEARTISIALKPGDIDPERLTVVQDMVQAGTLQLFGGAYLQWVARRPKLLDGREFREVRKRCHARLSSLVAGKVHLRILASLSTLLAVGTLVTQFVADTYGVEARDWVKERVQSAARSLALGVTAQAKEVVEASPFSQLLSALRDNLAAQNVCLYPAKGIGEGRERIPSKPGADVVGYYFTDDDKPAWVLLTRDVTFGWYEKECRARGSEPTFTWTSVMREAEDEYGGSRVDRQRVYAGGKSQQLSGVKLTFQYVVGGQEELVL